MPSSAGRSPQAAEVPKAVTVVVAAVAVGPATVRQASATRPASATTRMTRSSWIAAIPPASYRPDIATCASHWVGT